MRLELEAAKFLPSEKRLILIQSSIFILQSVAIEIQQMAIDEMKCIIAGKDTQKMNTDSILKFIQNTTNELRTLFESIRNN